MPSRLTRRPMPSPASLARAHADRGGRRLAAVLAGTLATLALPGVASAFNSPPMLMPTPPPITPQAPLSLLTPPAPGTALNTSYPLTNYGNVQNYLFEVANRQRSVYTQQLMNFNAAQMAQQRGTSFTPIEPVYTPPPPPILEQPIRPAPRFGGPVRNIGDPGAGPGQNVTNAPSAAVAVTGAGSAFDAANGGASYAGGSSPALDAVSRPFPSSPSVSMPAIGGGPAAPVPITGPLPGSSVPPVVPVAPAVPAPVTPPPVAPPPTSLVDPADDAAFNEAARQEALNPPAEVPREWTNPGTGETPQQEQERLAATEGADPNDPADPAIVDANTVRYAPRTVRMEGVEGTFYLPSGVFFKGTWLKDPETGQVKFDGQTGYGNGSTDVRPVNRVVTIPSDRNVDYKVAGEAGARAPLNSSQTVSFDLTRDGLKTYRTTTVGGIAYKTDLDTGKVTVDVAPGSMTGGFGPTYSIGAGGSYTTTGPRGEPIYPEVTYPADPAAGAGDPAAAPAPELTLPPLSAAPVTPAPAEVQPVAPPTAVPADAIPPAAAPVAPPAVAPADLVPPAAAPVGPPAEAVAPVPADELAPAAPPAAETPVVPAPEAAAPAVEGPRMRLVGDAISGSLRFVPVTEGEAPAPPEPAAPAPAAEVPVAPAPEAPAPAAEAPEPAAPAPEAWSADGVVDAPEAPTAEAPAPEPAAPEAPTAEAPAPEPAAPEAPKAEAPAPEPAAPEAPKAEAPAPEPAAPAPEPAAPAPEAEAPAPAPEPAAPAPEAAPPAPEAPAPEAAPPAAPEPAPASEAPASDTAAGPTVVVWG